MTGSGEAIQSGMNKMSVLRLARLLRLARMTRLAKAAPEMVTLLKGIFTALRSVFFTVVLLGILLFLFGIVFRNLEDTYAELKPLGYFQTVATSMWTLLVHGVFLD